MHYDELPDVFVQVIAKRAKVEDLDLARKVMEALNDYSRGSRIKREDYDYGEEGQGNAMADAISTFATEWSMWSRSGVQVPVILDDKVEDMLWAENYWRTHGGTENPNF